MKKFLVIYSISFIVFLIVDLFWIKYVVGPVFEEAIGSMMLKEPRMGPALIFYALFVLGIVTLVVYPSLDRSWGVLIGRAILFGVTCYATYELTNYATLKSWTLKLVLLDLTWGASIAVLVAGTGYGFSHYLDVL